MRPTCDNCESSDVKDISLEGEEPRIYECNDCGYVSTDYPSERESKQLLCGTCNGSGEGRYDGTKCPSCFGNGVEPEEADEW